MNDNEKSLWAIFLKKRREWKKAHELEQKAFAEYDEAFDDWCLDRFGTYVEEDFTE